MDCKSSRLHQNQNRNKYGRTTDFTPVHYSKYFDSKELVKCENEDDRFCVYQTSSTCIANDPASDPEDSIFNKSPLPPIIILIHGAGLSGLTWSETAKILCSSVKCKILAFDLRGHGETRTRDESDLSIERLSSDLLNIIRVMDLVDNPLIFIGQSLGGAIAVSAVTKISLDEEMKVLAVIVLDIVEESAIELMQNIHRNRPKSFPSLEKAIEWTLKSGQVKNSEMVRVSCPSQLKCSNSNLPATLKILPEMTEIDKKTHDETNIEHTVINIKDTSASAIKDKNETEAKPKELEAEKKVAEDEEYIWRIDLAKTESHWSSWFENLSSNFLALQIPKLILTGVDRLDRDLTIGQMQGKFQMHVLSKTGHLAQEDSPEEVSQVITQFLIRNQLVEPLIDIQSRIGHLSC